MDVIPGTAREATGSAIGDGGQARTTTVVAREQGIIERELALIWLEAGTWGPHPLATEMGSRGVPLVTGDGCRVSGVSATRHNIGGPKINVEWKVCIVAWIRMAGCSVLISELTLGALKVIIHGCVAVWTGEGLLGSEPGGQGGAGENSIGRPQALRTGLRRTHV